MRTGKWTLYVVVGTLCAFFTVINSVQGLQVPFVLPWDDSTGGPADFSKLNTPIGAGDVVTVNADGHFEARGQRIRFLGVNFAGDSPFAPTNRADGMAARLAKFGVNCVRLHHMDAPWALNGGMINYNSDSSRPINLQQLDKVQYMVSRLKAHGIYADVNLLVGRVFHTRDGLPAEVEAMDWKDQHVLGFFYDPALSLHQEYATRVLTPVNPHTGLPLAGDPAVAFVEIMNENGMLQKWFEGSLDKFPAVFQAPLQTRWNEWLRARYTNDANLQQAWNIIDQPLGVSMLRNGTFTNGFNNWVMEKHDVADARFTVTNDFNGAPAAKIEMVTVGSAGWHIQLNQPNLRVTNAQPYTLCYWAKASQSTTMDTSAMQAHANWEGLGFSQTVKLTTNWQQFTATFQPTSTDTNARVNFGGFATQKVTVWIANVVMQPGGQIGVLPNGANLAQGTVPNVTYSNMSGSFTREARKDWIRFLRDLEHRYYQAMVTHLRTACGYHGLVFGTIIANSPPSIQAELDVVDGHAYWQHPAFPGIPWDGANWYIPNTSMVNTLGDDNTITGLARQRVRGKPFTVTEYQHPSPNDYGAEGPVMLAAYGALQDWDGLWMFDYGAGNDTAGAGYFHSYFDLWQHPTKMANLMLAAAIFRRGDVQSAQKEYVLPVTPETEVDTIASRGSSWSVMNSGQLGMPGKLAFASRLSMSVGTNATGLATPPAAPAGSVISSDTGELTWNTSTAGKGTLQINTPKTRLFSGFSTGQEFDLGGVKIRPGATQLGWCTVGLTLTHGEDFTQGGSALMVVCGEVNNTGMEWKDASRTSVGMNWGHAPVLAEVVPLILTLPMAPERVKVFALDERGQRKTELTVGGTNGFALIEISTSAATIWYEILMSRNTAFDRWRFEKFTADELMNDAVSGPLAAPAGDGISNLLKYAMGLLPKTLAPRHLVAGGRIAQDAFSYFTMTYTHSKAATDVVIVPEVSGDLNLWNSGTNYLVETLHADLGATEEITVRDLIAMEMAAQRFLRLKVAQQ